MISDLHFLNKRFGEKLNPWEEPKLLQFLQTEENQDSTNTDLDSLELSLNY